VLRVNIKRIDGTLKSSFPWKNTTGFR